MRRSSSCGAGNWPGSSGAPRARFHATAALAMVRSKITSRGAIMRRIRLVIALALGLSPAAAAAQTSADSWPTRQPIRVVVPLTAGSATDAVARVVFEQVGRQIGQTVVIENRVGAAQTIGAAAVAKAEPDGYTVLVNSSSHTVFPSTFASLPFDVVRDFAAVTPLANIPTAMVIAPSKGFTTMQDFVAAARAKPGS